MVTVEVVDKVIVWLRAREYWHICVVQSHRLGYKYLSVRQAYTLMPCSKTVQSHFMTPPTITIIALHST